MIRHLSISALTIIVLFSQACKPDAVEPLDRGETYFPLKVGRQLEYKVDSIIFDDDGATNKLDTFSSFIREHVTGVLVDLNLDSIYIIERSFRRSVDDNWTTTDVWTTYRTFTTAFRVEENQRLIKFELPLFDGKTWDPVRFIDPGIAVPVGTEEIEMFSYWAGSVASIDVQESVGPFVFDDVMTCYQANEDTEIERRFVREKYARGLGLVARTDTILDSRCKRLGDFAPCLGKSWIQKGEKGYILYQELIAHN
jgi:hypothetical protein